MIAADVIARARTVPLDRVIRQRGIKLHKEGAELVGPCPKCAGHDRFAVHLRKQVWNCRQCGGKGAGAISLVMFIDGCDFRTAIETLAGEAVPTPVPSKNVSRLDDAAQARKAKWLWSRREPISDSPAETYLRAARGLRGPFPAALGYLPPSKPEHRPALIAAAGMASEHEPGVVAIADDAVKAVHLILLKADGSGKADVEPNKLSVGPIKGAPIMLAPMNDLLGLAIAEGIEDALAIHEATGLGAWAAGSAPMLPALADAVPDYTDCVSILVDDDDAGHRHAGTLAARLRTRGLHVEPIKLRGPPT
jgi:phage/plasmid primase-like uncharacterized protein